MQGSWSARSALTTLLVTIASLISTQAHAACGDGTRDGGETCDDRNTQSGDGCTASCQIEAGYVCSGTPSACCFQDAAAAYALIGDARLDDATGIVTLTPDATWKMGTAWYRQPLDFTNPFTVSARLYLGMRDGSITSSVDDQGADGGSLLFHRDPRGLATVGQYAGSAGGDGGELGAKGIAPVVGVEFDTYNNGAEFGDDTMGDEDHTSVFHGGTHPQSNELAPATCMNNSFNCTNFEDGGWHRLDVSWTGDADHALAVYFDGALRIRVTNDLVNDYFSDAPGNILFGFAASTGGHYNLQQFCPLAPYGFSVPRDRDQDGSDDAADWDSDGDGATDLIETASVFGTTDPDADHDADGVPNYQDVGYWTEILARASDCPDTVAPIGACDSLLVEVDFDRDGVADHLDLDSDADGTPDASDSAARDACMPAISAACPQSVMDAGVDASAPLADAAVTTPDASMRPPEGPTPGDLDGDQVPNEVDAAPSNPCIPNRNALACGTGDADGDHLSNEFECPGLRMCRDTDGDGVSDYADTDSDGDGIPDARECADMNACPDMNGDGVSDWISPATAKSDDGCSLARRGSASWLTWLLLLLSVRTGSRARSASARACGALRSLLCSRAARRPPPATPRSSLPSA